jgi:hypothetical protein
MEAQRFSDGRDQWALFMKKLGIDLNNRINQFMCPHCGEQSLTVWGYVSQDQVAHSIYYANLMTGHKEASARLTISFGGWGEEDDVAKRRWVFIEARPTADRYEMMVREPEESLYHDKTILGSPMTRAEVLGSSLKDEIFEIADFIAFNDPAVKSYLSGEEIDRSGRNSTVN